MGDCENNKFSNNDFIRNTFDVATNSENNPNEFADNYWSQYEGYDLNHDGIGDIPYRPVSLSSVIMENVDSSFILIKSFLLAMLDGIERKRAEESENSIYLPNIKDEDISAGTTR
jgi:nitrous oxidase accessory protein